MWSNRNLVVREDNRRLRSAALLVGRLLSRPTLTWTGTCSLGWWAELLGSSLIHPSILVLEGRGSATWISVPPSDWLNPAGIDG